LDLVSRGFQAEASRFFDTSQQDFSQQFPADIQQLAAVKDPLHVRQNQVASLYRQNKYTLLMSSYAFELLLSYLMDSHFMTLLKLVNQYINIKVYSTKPISAMRQDAAVVGITGHTSHQIQSVNQQKLFLGLQPMEPHFQEILEKKLKQLDSAAAATDAYGSSGGGLMEAFDRVILKRSGDPVPRADAVPLPPPTNQKMVEVIEKLNDVRARIKLSSTANLPSVVTYTFHNTGDTLASCAFSADSKMAATGFADSYVKIWSLTGEPLRSLKASVEYNAADFENGISHSHTHTLLSLYLYLSVISKFTDLIALVFL
jgi:transcription initiation factor TFIID subunit 5